MGYSLGQAAKAAGVSKTSIHRAIKTGRLSASRIDGTGYDIDPAELSRVYPGNGHGNGAMERSVTAAGSSAELLQVQGERDRFRALGPVSESAISPSCWCVKRDRGISGSPWGVSCILSALSALRFK